MLAKAMPAKGIPTSSGRTPISLAKKKLKVGRIKAPTNPTKQNNAYIPKATGRNNGFTELSGFTELTKEMNWEVELDLR